MKDIIKKHGWKFSSGIAVLVLLFGISVTIFRGSNSNVINDALQIENSNVSTLDQDNNGELSSEQETVKIQFDRLLAYKSYEDLIHESNLVLSCRLEEISTAFRVRDTDGGERNYTEYYFTPIQVYRGEEFAGDYVAVRKAGGAAGGYEEIYSDAYNFETGKEYLLFLYTPMYQLGLETDGEYFYITGSIQGIFEADGSFKDMQTQVGNGTEDVNTTMGELVKRLSSANKTDPPQEDIAWQIFLENQKGNLANGMITRENYDEWTTPSKKYATYITAAPQYSKAIK